MEIISLYTCTRCGGLLHGDRVPNTDVVLDTCYSCGESTDALIILNRLYPDYSPPSGAKLPGHHNPTKIILDALDVLDEDIFWGNNYPGSLKDMARSIGVKPGAMSKVRAGRKKRRIGGKA